MKVSVLIPTYNRTVALAATVTALTSQQFKDFDVIISDQGDHFVGDHPTIQSIVRILELHGNPVRVLRNHPRLGMAQQRDFLLRNATGQCSLFIDDDVILEYDALQRMVDTLDEQQCGFVGMGLIGLSYRYDVRPHEQVVEFWDGNVLPEVVRPGSAEWQRYKVHNAANIYHISKQVNERRAYKVAWVGGCILYDTEKLRSCGGFSFWSDLPEEHCGEDVLAQLRVMERFGGCGVLPSGAYHQEVPTTIPNREVNAPECLQ